MVNLIEVSYNQTGSSKKRMKWVCVRCSKRHTLQTQLNIC